MKTKLIKNDFKKNCCLRADVRIMNERFESC